MLYILDTDHISLAQYQHPAVLANLDKHLEACAVTIIIISLFEQLQGRLATLNRAKNEAEATHAFSKLMNTFAP